MNFWKEHNTLRIILMLIFFAAGMGLLMGGWKMNGQVSGLFLMLTGLISLLAALFIYNKPFEGGSSR